MHIALEAVLLKLHAKLAPGWVLICVNIDPVQEIGPKVGGGRSFMRPWYNKYCSLMIECPWVEHLTSLPKTGVGTLSSVSAFNHERAPMYVCLHQLIFADLLDKQ